MSAHVEIPPRSGVWRSTGSGQVRFNDNGITEAVDFALENETDWAADLSEQKAIARDEPPPWNEVLGPLKPRGGPAGVIVNKGKLIAEWGNPERVDTTFSATKSYIALCAIVALKLGLIRDLDDRLRDYDLSDHFEASQNRPISWRHLLQQTSEWEGTLWTKPDQVDRNRQVGPGSQDSVKGGPRELKVPGTHWEYNDVRVNRTALALLAVWNEPLPDVLKREVMDQIGASSSWEWHGYEHHSEVNLDGLVTESVSGGAHWGGGLWINTLDHARFGLLYLNRGKWGDHQIVSDQWIDMMTTPCDKNDQYGYMWWLNTGHARYGKHASESSFAASGAGGNCVVIDPEKGLVVVTRWCEDVTGVFDLAAQAVGS